MCKEYWRPIIGFEGHYEVSNYGRVKSLRYKRTNKEGYLTILRRKYDQVHLQCGNKSIYPLVHRIMMKAFVPNPNNLPCVNHKDENHYNNFIWVNEDGSIDLEKSNLEWCDYSYNNKYGTRIKRISRSLMHSIIVFSNELCVGEFESVRSAAEYFCFPRPCISRALKNKKPYKKMLWKYKKEVA